MIGHAREIKKIKKSPIKSGRTKNLGQTQSLDTTFSLQIHPPLSNNGGPFFLRRVSGVETWLEPST